MRPFGTYTDRTRTGPQVAASVRASCVCSSPNPGSPGRPRATSSSPTRDSTATPFQRPSPWLATAYPSGATASAGNASAPTLVSCRQTTSGPACSSQPVSRGSRASTELTFQVAMRTPPSNQVGPAGNIAAATGLSATQAPYPGA